MIFLRENNERKLEVGKRFPTSFSMRLFLSLAIVFLYMFSFSTLSMAENWPVFQEVEAEAYLLIDQESGQELLALEEEMQVLPGSMTKFLTALTVLKDAKYSPHEMIEFTETSVQMPNLQTSVAGYLPGEQSRTDDAIRALLLADANDAAKALAEHFGPGEEAFVRKMNALAEHLGCQQSLFIEPGGLDMSASTSTPRDLVKIMSAAWKEPLIREILQQDSLSLPASEKHPYTAWMSLPNPNTLTLLGARGYGSAYLERIVGLADSRREGVGDFQVSVAKTTDGKTLLALLFNPIYVIKEETAAVEEQPLVGEETEEELPEEPTGQELRLSREILSRAFLEAGAMKLGAPALEKRSQEEEIDEEARESKVAEIAAIREGPVPTYTLETIPIESEDDTGTVSLGRGLATGLIILFSIFLFSTLFLAYSYSVQNKKLKAARKGLKLPKRDDLFNF